MQLFFSKKRPQSEKTPEAPCFGAVGRMSLLFFLEYEHSEGVFAEFDVRLFAVALDFEVADAVALEEFIA